jgi:hypothetical protein
MDSFNQIKKAMQQNFLGLGLGIGGMTDAEYPSRAPGDKMPDPRSVVQREFDRLMRDVERQKDRIAMARNTIKDEEAHLAALEAAALKFRDWLDRR